MTFSSTAATWRVLLRRIEVFGIVTGSGNLAVAEERLVVVVEAIEAADLREDAMLVGCQKREAEERTTGGREKVEENEKAMLQQTEEEMKKKKEIVFSLSLLFLLSLLFTPRPPRPRSRFFSVFFRFVLVLHSF